MIQKISGTYTPYVVFTDWCKMLALAIANATELEHNDVWQYRENLYIETAKKYSKENIQTFVQMNALLVRVYEDEGPYDALGEIYMMADCGNKATGQFFTPFHISLLTASMYEYPDGIIEINEPSCGAGSMILAAASIINKRGGNAQRQLKIVAQDIDWNSIYMTYIQLSLNGLDAICIQGNTLTNEVVNSNEKLRTPKNRGLLL